MFKANALWGLLEELSQMQSYFFNEFDPKQHECFSAVYENIRWFLLGAQGLLPWPKSLGKGQELLIKGSRDVHHPHLPRVFQILAFLMSVYSHIPMDSPPPP